MIKVLYAGSPSVSAKMLSYLYEKSQSYEIVGVLTNEPSAQGRHKTLVPTAVEQFAREHNIKTFSPSHLDKDFREEVIKVKADILVCFAYGKIFGPKFLSLFSLGGINLHPSLLPKYRGPTPINATILNLDKQTAITVQTLSLGMDEGDILGQKIIDLDGSETAGNLLDIAAFEGANIIKQILKYCDENNKLPDGKKQTGKASYTKMITKNDCLIDWTKSATEIDAHIRAYFPEPCAWTVENSTPLKIISAKEINNYSLEKTYKVGEVISCDKNLGIIVQTGKGVIAITKLQRQGKKEMDFQPFINGARNFVGTVLGK